MKRREKAVPGERWRRLLWALVFPRRRNLAEPTVSGLMLFCLCMGTGTAAYNSASNILFIALSLLLASLLLSGLLSWLNLRSVRLELRVAPPLRAGQSATVEVVVRNAGRLLPVHGLWFNLKAALQPEPDAASTTAPESRESSAGHRQLGQRLARVEAFVAEGRVALCGGLASGEERSVAWSWTPARRGRWRVELEGMGSLFPFGFLRKTLPVGEWEEVLVWPASIAYQHWPGVANRNLLTGHRSSRAGHGSDLLALRAYELGDSHRLIHWKASARHGSLLVRRMAAEKDAGVSLLFDPAADRWDQGERFEVAVSLAATYAEDLFKGGHLRALGLGSETPVAVRRLADLEAWLDRLATLALPGEGAQPVRAARPRRLRIIATVHPDGPRGAAAYVDGQKIAAA